MKIFKFEYTIDSNRNREWFDAIATHISYYKENNTATRLDFSKMVGINNSEFVEHGKSAEYLGYKITEIEVK